VLSLGYLYCINERTKEEEREKEIDRKVREGGGGRNIEKNRQRYLLFTLR
jgi:hypothetical protein